MKNIQILFLFFISTFSFGQNKEISLDYTVTYEIPSQKRNTVDTVSVSFNKKGTFLHTDARFIIDKFSAIVFKNKNVDLSNASSSIIYDTNSSEVYMHFDIQNNIVYMKMNLDDIIPIENEGAFSDDVKIISEKQKDDTFILNKSYATYVIYPDTEPNSRIQLVIDENHPVSNNTILKKFFELMLTKTNSEGSIDIDLPEGLILSVLQGDSSLIKAIDIDTDPLKINISHSFNIEK